VPFTFSFPIADKDPAVQDMSTLQTDHVCIVGGNIVLYMQLLSGDGDWL